MTGYKEKTQEILHIDTIVREGIPNRFDITEYRSGESFLVVTHRYDGISEKHLFTALHTHNYYEFELVYGGHGIQIAGGSSFSMSRGRACLRTPNNPHTTHEEPSDKLQSYNIRFTADFIPHDIPTRMLAQNSAVCVCFEEEELQKQIEKIKNLADEIRRNDTYSRLIAESLLNEIMAAFARKCETATSEKIIVSRHVSKVLHYIDGNFRKNLSVSLLAQIFGLNSHYLGSLFMTEVGKSIPQYILDIRLILAAQLLSASSLSINEIAYECGFSSPSYFILKFRKRYGRTPRQYMRENEKTKTNRA